MKHVRSPRVMLTLSMVIFGTIPLFVRAIPLTSAQLALCRAGLAALLLGGYLLISGQGIPLKTIRRELPLLLLSGVAMGFNWILLFEAYKYTTVSVATLSYYFAPVLVTMLCPLLFHEKLTRRQVLCFAASTLGLVLVTGLGELSGGSAHGRGVLFGLGAAVLYASVVLINKFIRGVGGIQRTFWQFGAAAVTLLPYVLLTEGLSFAGLNAPGWLSLLTVCGIHTGLAYCLYFTALKDVPGQEAAILSYADPLVAVLLSVTLLGEPLTLAQALGGLLILGFTLWNELKPE